MVNVTKYIQGINLVILLHIANYIFLSLYFASMLGIRYFFTTNRRKYFRVLNTIYTLGIGLLLISLKFPFLIDLRNRASLNAITHLMLSAGLIVMSTLSAEDISELWSVLIPKRRLSDIES